MLDRAIDGLKSDEAKALREFSGDIADANNLSLMAFSTESACSTEQ